VKAEAAVEKIGTLFTWGSVNNIIGQKIANPPPNH
jgi:hypothetical protein